MWLRNGSLSSSSTNRVRLGAILGLAAVLLVSCALVNGGVAAQASHIHLASATPARASHARLFAAGDAATAFRAAGLPLDDFHQQTAGPSGPSGPPATEREAWAFSIPSIAPRGGRLLIFADDNALQKKAAWYTHAGSDTAITIHGNIILWLDPALAPTEAARYRQALEGLR